MMMMIMMMMMMMTIKQQLEIKSADAVRLVGQKGFECVRVCEFSG